MIRNNIKEYRRKFKITQDELAQELGVSKQYISKLEVVEYVPGLDIFFKIIKAFRNITEKKSGGMMVKELTLDDLVYDDDYI
jgi:putative transcriptional regulator